MKKILLILSAAILAFLLGAPSAQAAGGIYASGGGTKNTGANFTIYVTASGATFNAFQGRISVSGPVRIIGFSAGAADFWSVRPANGATFAGALLGRTASSFTIASITLQGTTPGSGAVSVSGVSLLNAGVNVGSGAGSASFTIVRAPTPPGALAVSSSSHPDQNTSYEATTIVLSWNKPSGVTNFSYLLDQSASTTPPAQTTSTSTTVTYDNKAVGIYYFHIRAQNGDGWGSTTHFRINIKEPDAKIDSSLPKPKNLKITKATTYVESLTDGTVTGIKISGLTQPGFTANLTLTPAPTIPAGKTLSSLADTSGKWSLVLDYPIAAGFHKLTVQGQKDKVLTPISDEITFEINLAKGGSISILTASDTASATPTPTPAPQSFLSANSTTLYGAAGLVVLIFLASLVIIKIRRRKRPKE